MGATSFITAAVATGLAASSLSKVLPGVTARGRTIVAAVCGLRALGAPTFVLADDKSNAWAEAVTMTLDVGLRRLSIHIAKNCAEGLTTVTVTPSGASDLTLAVAELGTIDPGNAFAGTNTGTGTGAAPSLSLTPANEDNFVIGAFTHLGASLSMDAGSGYTNAAETENPASGPPLLLEGKLSLSTGAVTVDGAIGSSATWGMVAVALRRWNLYVPVATIVSGPGGGYAAVATGAI